MPEETKPQTQTPKEGAPSSQRPEGDEDGGEQQLNQLPEEVRSKFHKLRQEAKSLRTRLRESETVNQELAASEMAKVPETMRHLIPAGSSVEKVKWVRDAFAAGMFTPGAAAPAPVVHTPLATAPAPALGPRTPEPLTARERQELGSPGITFARKQELLAKRDAHRNRGG